MYASKAIIGNLPTQVHLSLHEDATMMNVNWAFSLPSNLSQVRYGTESGVYSFSAEASYHQYISTWDSYISPYLYSATMKNLSPSTTYFYRVGDQTSNLWSGEFSFKTVPNNFTKEGIRIVAYGDQGDTDNSQKLVDIMQYRGYTNLVIHAGDIAYANGNTANWDEYMQFIEPLAASTPYMVCPGNHETAGGENFVPYSNLFAMPNNKFWYSFNYGPMHIIAMSTEHPYDTSSVQYQFIEDDLQNVNRTEYPWIFIFAHKPPYNSNANYGSFIPVRDVLDPLLTKYSVDLAIFGHEHSYERTFPLKNGAPATTAKGTRDDPYVQLEGSPIYFVIGTGGEGLRNKWSDPAPEWSAHREATHHGYASIYVRGDEFVHWQFIRDDNLVSDEFYICKSPPCNFSEDPNGDGITASATMERPYFMSFVAFIVSILLLL